MTAGPTDSRAPLDARTQRFGIAVGAAIAAVALIGLIASAGGREAGEAATDTTDPEQQIVVGEVEGVEPLEPGPGVIVEDDGTTLRAVPEPGPAAGLLPPDGNPTGRPIPFDSDRTGVDQLVFVVVAGSDARPGEDVLRSRADSLHVVAINPTLGRGTIVGIPRDAWVPIPGHGEGKINSALVLGGPDLLARTVADVTGMPAQWYVVAGFDGFTRLVDDLGGVDVYVERRMNDRNSGARFDRGWHWFHGDEALAFGRNRKDTAFGDFSRSENQGVLMLATLAKMRAEIGDEGALGRWLDALRRHVRLDVGMRDLIALGVTARRTDPRGVANVVASGRVARRQGQSVVLLDDAARALFADVADDGVLVDPPPPYGPPGWDPDPAPATTTTTSSTPSPSTTVPTTVVPTTSTTSTVPGGGTSTTTSSPTTAPIPVN